MSAALLWSGNYVFGAAAVDAIDPLTLTWLVWALAAVPLMVSAHVIERPDWRSIPRRLPVLALLAMLGLVGCSLLTYAALASTTPLNASLISGASPVLVAVLAAVVCRTRFGVVSVCGLALGLGGVLFVLTGDPLAIGRASYDPGDLLMLAAVAAWSTYTLLVGRIRDIPPITATAVQAVVAAVVLAGPAALSGIHLPAHPAAWLALGYLVVFSSTLGYLFWNMATRQVSPVVAAMSLNLLVVFTAVLGIPFGYGVSGIQALGGVLVISGVVLASLGQTRVGASPGAPTAPD